MYVGNTGVLFLGYSNTEGYGGLNLEFTVAEKILKHSSSGEISWKAATWNNEEVGHETIIFKINFLLLL
jgi:hypothetical protein